MGKQHSSVFFPDKADGRGGYAPSVRPGGLFEHKFEFHRGESFLAQAYGAVYAASEGEVYAELIPGIIAVIRAHGLAERRFAPEPVETEPQAVAYGLLYDGRGRVAQLSST